MIPVVFSQQPKKEQVHQQEGVMVIVGDHLEIQSVGQRKMKTTKLSMRGNDGLHDGLTLRGIWKIESLLTLSNACRSQMDANSCNNNVQYV